MPWKGFFKTIATFPMVSPPFVLSLSDYILFSSGLSTLTGILGSLAPSVEDAALNLGTSRGHIFKTVTLLAILILLPIMAAFLLQSYWQFRIR